MIDMNLLELLTGLDLGSEAEDAAAPSWEPVKKSKPPSADSAPQQPIKPGEKDPPTV